MGSGVRPTTRATPQRIGQRAEQVAADYYHLLGHEILGRNVRLGHLEIDLVTRRRELLVVVEVRARGPGSYVSAFGSLNGAKMRRLRTAAQRLWRRWEHDPSVRRIRLDVAAVDLWSPAVTIEVAEAIPLG